MTKIFFSRKHLITAGAISIVVMIMVIIFWLFLINPKRIEVFEQSSELELIQSDIQKIRDQVVRLENEPDLLDSEVVRELPHIPNGVEIESFFKDVEELEDILPITILQSTFNQEMVFPNQEQVLGEFSNEMLSIQLRATRIGFDLLSTNSNGMIDFIEHLENMDRFLKIESIEYRKRNDGNESEAVSASMIIKLYYLSNYETDQSISE